MDSYTLFLFAHQDDEFGVFHTLKRIQQAGGTVRIIYLTSGNPEGTANPLRNAESLKVLSMLGVSAEAVQFLGESAKIPDGRLVEHLDVAFKALDNWMSHHAPPNRLFTHAYEGGHQDHDAAYLLGLHVAQKWGMMDRAFQTALYCKDGIPTPFFRMFHPLKANGSPIQYRIPLKERLRYLGFYFAYRSQWKSWIGLWPFVLLHYLFEGTEVHQPLIPERLTERPHSGSLLYEQRGFFTFERFSDWTTPFMALGLTASDTQATSPFKPIQSSEQE